MTDPKPIRFHHYRDAAGDWRWRAQAANGRVLADSAEGYQSERNVVRALASFQAGFAASL